MGAYFAGVAAAGRWQPQTSHSLIVFLGAWPPKHPRGGLHCNICRWRQQALGLLPRPKVTVHLSLNLVPVGLTQSQLATIVPIELASFVFVSQIHCPHPLLDFFPAVPRLRTRMLSNFASSARLQGLKQVEARRPCRIACMSAFLWVARRNSLRSIFRMKARRLQRPHFRWTFLLPTRPRPRKGVLRLEAAFRSLLSASQRPSCCL